MGDYCCFKYRAIDKRLLELLIRSAMYFPHRAQLNDPFDCNVNIVQAIERAIKHGGSGESELLKKLLEDDGDLRRFGENVGKIGVGSFSLSHNETLLWSHYANNHSGVVLRYDFPREYLADEENILGVAGVSYEPNAVSGWLIENACLYKDDHQAFITGLLKKVLMSKSPAWAYEQEARIVRPSSGHYELPRSALTHVIFGLQTSESDEKLVRAVVERYYEKVKFGRAVRTSDDFGISTVEL